MDRVELFTHGSNAFVMFKFPARRESVFEFRMPEHWGSPRMLAKYADHGPYIRVHGGANDVEWEILAPHHVRSKWTPGEEADPWNRDWSYVIDFEGFADTLDCRMALTYKGEEPWDGPSLLACMRNRMADPFIDPDGTRSYLFTQDGPITVNDLTHGEFPSHRMVGSTTDHSEPQKRLSHPIMATLTEDGAYAAFIGFADSKSCSSNFGSIHCIHSNPTIEGMQPGETRMLHGRVYCIPVSGPEDALARWEKDLPDMAG